MLKSSSLLTINLLLGMIWAFAIVLQNTENGLQNQNMVHTGTEPSVLNLSM